MYKDISEDIVISIIKSKDEMIAKIHTELIKIFTSIDTDDFISAATFNSQLRETTSKTNAKHDLHDVYEQYCKINHEWSMSVKLYARDLVERLETINRIVACFNNLPEQEKNVLVMLYIKHPFKEGKKILEAEYQISARTILRVRRVAIDKIIKMYYSNASNLELYNDNENKNNKYR